MSMISVLIPVYKESNLLETLLNQLLKDEYRDKEIITVIDEPTKTSMNLAKKYKKQVKFILNKVRKGKVTALNEATKIAKGDIFLFLDSDIKVNSDNFLSKVVDNIRNHDIIDFKVDTISNSFFSKIVNYDYLAMNFFEHLFSGVKRSMGVNGAAFAVKKDFFQGIGGLKNVPLEDWEIGFQSYLNNKAYKHVEDISISTKVPSFMKNWLSQRKRWSIGAGIQCRNHWKDYLKVSKKYPKISLLSLIFMLPLVITFLFSFSLFEDAIFFSIMLLTFKLPFLFPIFFFASWSLLLFKNIFLFSLSYLSTSVIFYVASKKINFNYKNREFLCYYILYSPISTCFYLFHFIRGIFSSEEVILEDWKV